jgi:Tol biopolymer transport system component
MAYPQLVRLLRDFGQFSVRLGFVLSFWTLSACVQTQSNLPTTKTESHPTLIPSLTGSFTPTPTSTPAARNVSPDFMETLEPIQATANIISTPTNDSPAITPYPIPSIDAWDNISEFYPLIAITYQFPPRFLLFSPDGSSLKEIDLETKDYYPQEIQQIGDDCKIIALVNSNDGNKLILVNPNGKSPQEIFQLPNDQPDIVVKYNPIISPTGKFVTYVVLSGELYYDSGQYQDVEIVELSGKGQPIRLTTRGGVGAGGVWSPDGNSLAYTDFDEQGNLQVYITDIVNLTKRQLTQFQNIGSLPFSLSWSPKGDQLVAIIQNQQENDDAWVISTLQKPPYKLALPDDVAAIYKPYWSEDGKKLLMNISDDPESGLTGFYWLDVEKNQLLHVFTEKDASSINPKADSFAYPFPLTTDFSIVGYYNSRYEWYSYNAKNNQLEHLAWLDHYQQDSEYLIQDASAFNGNLKTCITR